MGTNETARSRILTLLKERNQSVYWLAEQAGLAYKPLLRALKHGSPLTLEQATACGHVLGVELPELVEAVA